VKAKDLKERSSDDLLSLKSELKRELFSSRMKNHTGRLSDTSTIGKARRDIARIEGILQARKGAQS
jgi:large subunit ribosomal protein L29